MLNHLVFHFQLSTSRLCARALRQDEGPRTYLFASCSAACRNGRRPCLSSSGPAQLLQTKIDLRTLERDLRLHLPLTDASAHAREGFVRVLLLWEFSLYLQVSQGPDSIPDVIAALGPYYSILPSFLFDTFPQEPTPSPRRPHSSHLRSFVHQTVCHSV